MLFFKEYLFTYSRKFSEHIQYETSQLLPLYLVWIVSNMLGFAGSAFSKSLHVFQVICRNWYRCFDKCDVSDVVLVILLLTLNTFYTFFWSFHCYFKQGNVSRVLLFQGVVGKTYQHFFQVNDTGHTFSSFKKRFVSGLILAVPSPMQQSHLELSVLLTKTDSHVKQGILDD